MGEKRGSHIATGAIGGYVEFSETSTPAEPISIEAMNKVIGKLGMVPTTAPPAVTEQYRWLSRHYEGSSTSEILRHIEGLYRDIARTGDDLRRAHALVKDLQARIAKEHEDHQRERAEMAAKIEHLQFVVEQAIALARDEALARSRFLERLDLAEGSLTILENDYDQRNGGTTVAESGAARTGNAP